MSADQIKLGDAFVKIGTDSSDLKKGLDTATVSMKDFSANAVKIANAIAIGWGACQAAVVAVTAHFASVGDQLDKMSQRTGIAAKSLSELSYVAGQCGASIEELEGLMFPLSEKVLEGDENFKKLGLSIENLQKLSPEMQFLSVADAISHLSTSTEQAAVATAMFGGDGEKLLPMLQQGAAGISELANKANELGIVLDSNAVKSAANMTDAFDNVAKATTALSVNLGAILAPTVSEICNTIASGIGQIIKWSKDNSILSSTLVAIAKNVTLVSGGLLLLYGAVKGCSIAYTALNAVQSKFWGFLKSGYSTIVNTYKAYKENWELLKMSKVELGLTTAATDYLSLANIKNTWSITTAAAACKVQTVAEVAKGIAMKVSGGAALSNATAQGVLTVASYVGAVAAKALSAAWLFFMATNPVGWILGLVAAIGALTAYLVGGESATTKYAKAMEDAKNKGDDLRKTHEIYAQRLETLNKKEELSAKEKGELIGIVAELNKNYAGLGMQIDPVTGKIKESDKALNALRDTMQKSAETDLNNALKALNDQLTELKGKLDENGEVSTGRAIGTWFTFGYMDNAEEIADQIKDIEGKINDLNRQKIKAKQEEKAFSDEYLEAEKKVSEWEEKDAEATMSEYEKKRYAISTEMDERKKTLQLIIDELEAKNKLSSEEKENLEWRKRQLKAVYAEEEKRKKLLDESIKAEANAQNKATAEDAQKQLNAIDEKVADQNRTEQEKKIEEIRKEFAERKRLLELYIESQSKRSDLNSQEKKDLEEKKALLKGLEEAEQARIDATVQAAEKEMQAEKDAQSLELSRQFNDRRQAEKDKKLDQQWRDMSARNPNNAEKVAGRNAMELELQTREEYKKMQRLIDSGASDEEKEAQRRQIDMMEGELATWRSRRDDLAIARVSNARNSSFSQPSIAIAGSLEAQRKFLENQQANRKNPMEEIGLEQVDWLEKIFKKQDELNNNFDFGAV